MSGNYTRREDHFLPQVSPIIYRIKIIRFQFDDNTKKAYRPPCSKSFGVGDPALVGGGVPTFAGEGVPT